VLAVVDFFKKGILKDEEEKIGSHLSLTTISVHFPCCSKNSKAMGTLLLW
jgi:hypothetical protein